MASLTEMAGKVLDRVSTPEIRVPARVEERIKRGNERLKEIAPRRRLAIEFANNEHYGLVDETGKVKHLSTVPEAMGGKKPDHRVRISRDLIGPVVKAKVSATTQRVPGYESIATSPDAEDFSAARLAEKIAAGGQELWQLKRRNKKLVWNALVTEEGFIRAFWDSNVGPYVEVEKTDPGTEEPTGETEHIGMGEVGVRVYSGLQVSWEPGVDFEESRWVAIEEARPVEELESEQGFQGPKLTSDAAASDSAAKKKGSKLCMVTEYLERPCPEYPEGQRLIIANGHMIFTVEPYPLKDHEDNVLDEPCLHRLSYDIDGNSDRDKGLVGSLIESMRAYDLAGNKIVEFAQQMLLPQWIAERNTLVTEMDDSPGAVHEYEPLAGGQPPKPRELGQVPAELERLQERSQSELGIIAHNNDIPAQKAESGKQAQTVIQKDELSWGDFVEDYAVVQARLMRDILTLVQHHYTEDRLIKFRGRTGWEAIADFKGADLRGQTDIRVSASSLEPRTKASNEQRIMNIAQMFPGHFPPEVLISALEGGSAEKLIEGYEDDVARANRIVTLIRSGQFWSVPMRPVFPGEEGPKIDPETGEMMMQPTGQAEPIYAGNGMPNPETGEEEQVKVGQRPQMVPVMETELPGWMPRPFDNIAVQKTVLTTWMKTDDWANLDEASQRASMDVYGALLKIEEREAQRQAMMQSQMAEDAGMANAAKLPQGKPLPSLPSLSNGSAEG